MKNLFRIVTNISLVSLLMFTACTDDWEEMNEDPNNPTVVPATNLLAQGIIDYSDFAYSAWFTMNNTASYAGHIGKIQYIDETRYYERESVISNHWRDIYRAAMDLENAKIFAKSEGNPNIEAAALTFQSLIFAVATDSWRDIPFSNAISGISTPIYDEQETIYPALLDSLEKANQLFAQGSTKAIGAGDVLFNDDPVKWQKFANSLRLRLANRIASVSTEGAAVRTAILADGATYPIMTGNDDNAYLYWIGTAPHEEPWAEDQFTEGRDDHAIGSYLMNYLINTADPRLDVIAKPLKDGSYRGVVPGQTNDLVGAISNYSRIGARFRDDRSGFTPFMNYAEVKFIEAEANNSQAAFVDAIVASFEENGLGSAVGRSFAKSLTFNLETLYYQKWVALFKNGHEAWSECRRTDVPVMSPAPGSRFPGHTRPPFRFAYPVDEGTLNGANAQPYRDLVTDRFWGKKMWWDERTGVN